ncbi:hypothetical protein NL676_000697 [Syzygium grande]|nr:hypothetical protein NL676_000697 [Syzygium grande]
MAIQSTPAPLFEKISLKNRANRAVEVFILFLLASLLVYRLAHIKDHGLEWHVALVYELWFTFVWVVVVSTKWSTVRYKTYPQRISCKVSEDEFQLKYLANELPPVDVFVTTADPQLEPPIITVNAVLSLMAVDYPAHKLSCDVSDDACSLLTFYSLMEATKFAELWVPFCKKYNIQLQAPFRYLASDATTLSGDDCLLEFQQAWHTIKDEYEKLSRKIEGTSQGSVPSDFTGEFAVFSNTERSDHPSIIKIDWTYGSMTKDIFTGLAIHVKGWRLLYCSPNPPAFGGYAPSGGPASMTQQKRWATGLLKVLGQEPAILTCQKTKEPAILILAAIFIIYNLYCLYEYFVIGLSIRAWWNNHRMQRITSAYECSFGVLSVVLKLFGLSEIVFEVTKKDQSTFSDDISAELGRFTFYES